MYWRVKNLSPEHLMRQYGVYLILAVSLVMNVFMFLTRPRGHKLEQELAPEFKRVATDVTNHLLDTSYISFADNSEKLSGEIIKERIQQMQNAGIVPKNQKDLKATEMTLRQRKQVACVRIDSVEQLPQIEGGLVPVEVSGLTAVHSSDGVEEKPFRFQFVMGLVGGDDEKKKVMVARFQEMPPKPEL